VKRITPAEVLRAYEATGLRPSRGVWFEVWLGTGGGETRWCGCGLTALALAAGLPERELVRQSKHVQALTVLGALDGIATGAPSYAFGFFRGFDGGPLDGMDRSIEAIRDGYADGVHAWQAVAQRYAL